ncbi:MAG: hypothetical protein FJW20_02500 [Acidimicrobiia bacterium]|nr:hypothetical protein [Acidimicrobiia bacterium]
MGGARDWRTIERRIEYASLPSQRRFHQLKARFKGFSGPIGSGKSQALCQEAIRLNYQNPGRMGLLGAPTYTMLKDATQVAFLEILRQNKIPFVLTQATNTVTMTDTGSKVIFRTLSEVERLRGTNLAWFGLDELTYACEDAWKRLEGRLRDPKASRLCGFAVWTPKGKDWVYKRFIQDRIDGYEVVLAPAFENRFLLKSVPDFYDRLKKSYDEQFFRQEVLGEYLNANSNRVYHAFRNDLQVRPLTLNRALPLLWALDFNVDPMCSVVAQIDQGHIHVLDEIVIRRSSTSEVCTEFLRRFGGSCRRLVIYGDASGNRRQTSGTTDYEIIRDVFSRQGLMNVTYRVPRSNPAVRDRIGLVNGKLLNADGETTLWVDGKCGELIKDFDEVRYLAESSEIDKSSDPLRTHVSDALGYLIWQEMGPKLVIGEKQNRLI